MYKTLRAIIGLFLSNFFSSSIFDKYFSPFQLYLFINVLIFETLSGFHLISQSFNSTVATY